MSTDRAESAEKFARSLNRADAIQGAARTHIEALVREVESLSNALVERDVKLTSRAAAPEPEWEERLAACAEHGTHCWSCARHKERRRPAGPWESLPVGGESDGE